MKGAKRLAEVVKVNQTLQWIFLNYENNIGDEGARRLAVAFKDNS